MAYRVKELIFSGWQTHQTEKGWTDTFELHVDALAGLPPADYAEAIHRMALPLGRYRPGANLWVKVDSPAGKWYVQALRNELSGFPFPYAVTSSTPEFSELLFSGSLRFERSPVEVPPRVDNLLPVDLSRAQLACIRTLARLDSACTSEVAAAAGINEHYVRRVCNGFVASGFMEKIRAGKYPYWTIRKSGISLALRSWGIPPGIKFLERKERARSGFGQNFGTSRHLRVIRLMNTWFKRSWPKAEIWTGWSELSLPGKMFPDGLAWGVIDGMETLFWLEVESGNLSTRKLREKTLRRANNALVFSSPYAAKIVFVLLGRKWVLEAAAPVFEKMPQRMAVVLGDWNQFGKLPYPRWQYVQQRFKWE